MSLEINLNSEDNSRKVVSYEVDGELKDRRVVEILETELRHQSKTLQASDLRHQSKTLQASDLRHKIDRQKKQNLNRELKISIRNN